MRLPRAGCVAILVAGLALTACISDKAPSPGTTTPGTSGSAPVTSPSGSPADWPMYHGSPDHSGISTTMPAANRPLRRVQSPKLDGAVYASPIVVRGLTVVATEHNSVYAFDQSYRQVWKRHIGSPSPASQRQCGNIDPLGITGTPVYDEGTHRIFVVTELGAPVRHVLYALDLATGTVEWTKSVDLPDVTARDMQQRGALAITGGRVWVPFGALAGDCGDYKGRVVGVPIDGGNDIVSYTPPTRRGGGMWNPAGPTVNAARNLLVVSANGAAFPGDSYDHTNSVIELNGDAQFVDSFAPTDWAANNEGDVGLGSQGVALIGNAWAVLGGKSGPVYVLRQGHLGGIGGQVDVQDICKVFGGAAVDGNVVYLPCTDGVRAVRVDDNGKLHVLWHASGSIWGSPVIGGGRVWALDPFGGVLHALDPATGKSVGQVDVGEASRFATPALYGRNVIVPTMAGIAVVSTS
jgi:outer membrane protein assembly factor BamB